MWGADEGPVVAGLELRRIARLHRQIAGRARSKSLGHRLFVSVGHDQRVPSLHQARRLERRSLFQTLLVYLDRQTPRQQRRRLLEARRIGVPEMPNLLEVSLQSQMLRR